MIRSDEAGQAGLPMNRIGRNIRGFVIGRKNFVVIDTVAGAKVSAICYSLAITARENGLNVYEYLKYLFQELPKRRKDNDPLILENCLPWSTALPKRCYTVKPDQDDGAEQLIMPQA